MAPEASAAVAQPNTAWEMTVLFMGVYPVAFTEVMHAAVDDLLRHVALPKL